MTELKLIINENGYLSIEGYFETYNDVNDILFIVEKPEYINNISLTNYDVWIEIIMNYNTQTTRFFEIMNDDKYEIKSIPEGAILNIKIHFIDVNANEIVSSEQNIQFGISMQNSTGKIPLGTNPELLLLDKAFIDAIFINDILYFYGLNKKMIAQIKLPYTNDINNVKSMIPVVDKELSGDSDNAIANSAVTLSIVDLARDLSQLETSTLEDLMRKENISNKVTSLTDTATDEQYPSAKAVYETFLKAIPQKEEESSGKSISITGAVPGLDVINYSIWGKCVQETQPTKENPQEVLCVGDLVTDSSDINYGKYKISYTYNAEEYALYLEEPLRGIVSYGYGGNSSNYRYILDYIDFKSQKVIRNVKEETIAEVSSIPEQGNIIYITAGLSDFYVRTVKGYSDMTTEHPGGVSNIGDVLSNCVQRVVRSGGSYVQSDSYVMAVDGYNNIYYYWDLNVLGFRVEEGTESDYLLKTSGASPAYYNVYDGDIKLTSFSQIRSKIGEIYDGEDFKIYYPLKSASEESIEIPEITVPAGGEVTLTVNTQTEPEKVSIEYYADITVTIKELEEKIEELTKAILSNGGNI